MRQRIALAVCVVTGAFMLLQFFSPHPVPEAWYRRILNWTIIIGIFAMGLGIVSLWMAHLPKVLRRKPGWGYSLVTLLGFCATVIVGLFCVWAKGQVAEAGEGARHTAWLLAASEESPFLWIYNNVLNPITATMFALLAFFIASASYRAFRVRSLLATIMLLAAVIVMMGRVPLGDLLSAGLLGKISNWLLNVPNLAAKRAILVGVGLGSAAVALKILLGIERSYLRGGEKK
jgi:hypothetical protein